MGKILLLLVCRFSPCRARRGRALIHEVSGKTPCAEPDCYERPFVQTEPDAEPITHSLLEANLSNRQVVSTENLFKPKKAFALLLVFLGPTVFGWQPTLPKLKQEWSRRFGRGVSGPRQLERMTQNLKWNEELGIGRGLDENLWREFASAVGADTTVEANWRRLQDGEGTAKVNVLELAAGDGHWAETVRASGVANVVAGSFNPNRSWPSSYMVKKSGLRVHHIDNTQIHTQKEQDRITNEFGRFNLIRMSSGHCLGCKGNMCTTCGGLDVGIPVSQFTTALLKLLQPRGAIVFTLTSKSVILTIPRDYYFTGGSAAEQHGVFNSIAAGVAEFNQLPNTHGKAKLYLQHNIDGIADTPIWLEPALARYTVVITKQPDDDPFVFGKREERLATRKPPYPAYLRQPLQPPYPALLPGWP